MLSTGKSTLSKEQWQTIETELSCPYGTVRLRCDGYEITAKIERLRALRSCIAVYVDGYIKGEWMRGGEIPLKFHRETKIFISSASLRAEAKKALRNKRLHKSLREFYQAAERSRSMWLPHWSNSKAFCRHLRKTCQSIEIVKVGYGE